MKRFRYCMNHKADEAYMAKMCHAGWAAKSLVEGVWNFVPCRPDQYVYRVCYLRGKSKEQVEALKRTLAAQGVEFVSRYSFWAIFRSERDFRLYTAQQERAICETIRRPMLAGSVLSWLAFAAALLLTLHRSAWFAILALLLGAYALMCTVLGISYTRLLHTMRREKP